MITWVTILSSAFILRQSPEEMGLQPNGLKAKGELQVRLSSKGKNEEDILLEGQSCQPHFG